MTISTKLADVSRRLVLDRQAKAMPAIKGRGHWRCVYSETVRHPFWFRDELKRKAKAVANGNNST